MKKLSCALAVLMLAALFAMPTSAASYEMLIGTPKVDGVIDDIYKQSASYTITTENKLHASGADYADCPEFKATSYFLYDDKYVYVATQVTDATIMASTKGDPAAAYVWENDVVEHWISIDGGATWGQFNLDAFGKSIGVGAAASFASKDVCQGAAKISGNSYVIEVKFPHEGKTDKICVSMQVNNILSEDGSKIVCIGKQKGKEYAITASDKKVVAAAAAPSTSAATADPAALAVAAIALSGAVIVASKKNKK